MSSPAPPHLQGHVGTLTLIHPVRPNHAEALREALERLGSADVSTRPELCQRWAAQWVLFDNDTRLLCALQFYGAAEALLRALARHEAARCQEIWGHCMGYPEDRARDIDAVAAYLAAGQVPITAALVSELGGLTRTAPAAAPEPLADPPCQTPR